MLVTIMIFHSTRPDGLTCVESFQENAESAGHTAMSLMRGYALADRETTGVTVPADSTGWVRVGSYLCCSIGDYFAVCHQPQSEEG